MPKSLCKLHVLPGQRCCMNVSAGLPGFLSDFRLKRNASCWHVFALTKHTLLLFTVSLWTFCRAVTTLSSSVLTSCLNMHL